MNTNTNELNAILSRVEAGTADARDAKRLREMFDDMVDEIGDLEGQIGGYRDLLFLFLCMSPDERPNWVTRVLEVCDE